MAKSKRSRSSLPSWEYQLFAFSLASDPADVEKHLDKRGANGWELVSMVARRLEGPTGPGVLVAVFKRPV